jgi:hypothetical protein
MNYLVMRNGQQFGPYSLADLQRYFQSGEIVATDLAKSEAMADWVPVPQVIGNIAVTPAPIPQSYGSVPSYPSFGTPGFGAAPTPMAGNPYPLPPDLHWVVVLLLSIVTCGLFAWVWMFIEATYVKKLRPANRSTVLYAIGFGILCVAGVMANNKTDASIKSLGGLLEIGGLIILVVGHFQLRTSLEEHFNTEEPISLQLSGVMVFFFNVVYFQYHLSRIRRWRTTGVLD